MSTRMQQSRKTRPLPWFLAALLAVLLASCLVLAAWTYMQEDDLKKLRASLEEQQQARSRSEPQIIALQSTVTALEERLATLEGQPDSQSLAPDSGDSLRRMEDLETAVTALEAAVEALGSTTGDPMADPSNQIPEETGAVPISHLAVPLQQQSHNLSCESTAVSMVAQYYGLSLSEEEVLASLPRNSNPSLGFRGNVDGPTGGIIDYGVYAGPVADFLNARGLQASMIVGGVEGIRSAIARGNPVIAWVTYNCMPSTPSTTLIDGQNVTLVPNQHVVVVTGVDSDGVWANDPWDGQEDYYPTGDFVRAMSYFGDMAIEIAGP